MEKNQAAARRVENPLRVVPGVIQTIVTGKLRVRFDPHAVAALRLVRMAEAEIRSAPIRLRLRDVVQSFRSIILNILAAAVFCTSETTISMLTAVQETAQ
jgi:hypothetical protein